MENNLFTRADRAAWLPVITGAIVTEKSAVLASVAACAFFARYNMDDAKKELHAHFVGLGYFLPKRPSIINEKMRRVVDAALALVEKAGEEVADILYNAPATVDGEAKAVNDAIALIYSRFTPGEGYPLNIGNKFLPMLTDDWSAEKCLSALAGEATEEEEASEAELDSAVKEGEEEATDTHADKIRRTAQAFAQAVLDTKARDGEAFLAIHAALDTFARAALKANGVYDIINQNGVPVTLGQADDAIVDKLAIEYGRATSHAATIKAEAGRGAIIAQVTETASAEALRKLEEKHNGGKRGRKAA